MAFVDILREKFPQYGSMSDTEILDNVSKTLGASPDEVAPAIGITPNKPGFTGDIKRGAGQMASSVGSTLQDLPVVDGLGKGLQRFGDDVSLYNPSQINSFGDVLSSPLTTAREAIGEMIPQVGASMAGGWAGARAGAAAGPAGVVAGGLLGGMAPIFAQEYGGIRQEQRAAGIDDRTRALMGAVPATALEYMGAERLAGRIMRKGMNEMARESGEGVLKHMGKQALIGGAIEGPLTEIPQSALERYGAYKDVMSPEALDEYGVAGAKGFLGGGAMRGGLAGFAGVRTPLAQGVPTDLLTRDTGGIPATAVQQDMFGAPSAAVQSATALATDNGSTSFTVPAEEAPAAPVVDRRQMGLPLEAPTTPDVLYGMQDGVASPVMPPPADARPVYTPPVPAPENPLNAARNAFVEEGGSPAAWARYVSKAGLLNADPATVESTLLERANDPKLSNSAPWIAAHQAVAPQVTPEVVPNVPQAAQAQQSQPQAPAQATVAAPVVAPPAVQVQPAPVEVAPAPIAPVQAAQPVAAQAPAVVQPAAPQAPAVPQDSSSAWQQFIAQNGVGNSEAARAELERRIPQNHRDIIYDALGWDNDGHATLSPLVGDALAEAHGMSRPAIKKILDRYGLDQDTLASVRMTETVADVDPTTEFDTDVDPDAGTTPRMSDDTSAVFDDDVDTESGAAQAGLRTQAGMGAKGEVEANNDDVASATYGKQLRAAREDGTLAQAESRWNELNTQLEEGIKPIAWKDLGPGQKTWFTENVAQDSDVETAHNDISDLYQGGTKFSRDGMSRAAPDGAGTTVASVQKVLRRLFASPERMGNKLSVVQSVDDVRAMIGEGAAQIPNDAQGMVYQNKAYLIADNIQPGQELAVFLHEVGAHMGMRSFLGEGGVQRLVGQINAWADKGGTSPETNVARAARKRVGDASDGVEMSQAVRDEELMAYFIEEAVAAGINPTQATGPIGQWLRAVWNAIKKALNAFGVDRVDQLTPQQIVDYAYGAAKMALTETAPPTPTQGQGQTRTPAFRKWFGDSQAVNADGTPLRVFHATTQDITQFDRSAESMFTYGDNPDSGGIFFTTDPDGANYYAQGARGFERGANVIPAYLSLQNPIRLDADMKLPEQARALREAEAAGYDGAIIGESEYVVFKPEQAKSAIGNDGSFDASNPDIRFSRAATAQLIDRMPAKAQEPLRYAADTVGDLARRGLYFGIFTNDLVESAFKRLPSAQRWYDAIKSKEVEKTRRQKAVDDIAVKVDALPRDQFKRTMDLVRDMTSSENWGYQPTWRGPVTVDADMAARYGALTSAEQSTMDAIFKHGADTIRDTQQVLDELVDAEFNQRLAGAAETDRAEIEKQREDYKKIFGRKLARLQGPYAPMRRVGSHLFVGKSQALLDAERDGASASTLENLRGDENHYMVRFFDSMAEAKAFERLDGPEGGARFDDRRVAAKQAYFNETNGLPFDAFQKIRSSIAMQSGDMAKKLNDLVTELYLTSLAETSARKSELRRTSVAGMTADGMYKAFISKGEADAHYISTLKNNQEVNESFIAMAREARQSKDAAATTAFNELAARYANTMKYDPSPFSSKLMAFTSVWQLLTKPAYYLFNATQVGLMTHPFIAQKFGAGASAGALTTAYKDYMAIPNVLRPGEVDLNKLPKDVRQAMRELIDAGKIDITLTQDLGSRLHGSRTQVGRGATKVVGWLRGATQKVEMMNRVVSATAAYRLAIQGGQTHAQAVEYASTVVDKTQGDYTNFNAPRLMNQNSAMRVLTQFRKFSLIQATFLVGAVREISKAGTPAEKWAASRMLRYTLANHAMLAGGLGLPLMNIVSAVFGAFGDDDEPKDLELEARKALGNGFMADLLTRGIPAAVFNTNISNNVGMSGAFAIMPFGDANLTTKQGFKDTAFSMLGPLMGLGAQFAGGIESMGKGDYYKGMADLLPSGPRAALKAFGESAKGVTNTRGDTLVTPEEVTLLDSAVKALGIRTTTDSNRQLVRSTQYKFEEFYKNRAQKLTQDYTRAYRSGDSAGMAEARSDWADLQVSRQRNGFKVQPLATLMRAPVLQRQREQRTIGGIQFNRQNQRFVQDATTEE